MKLQSCVVLFGILSIHQVFATNATDAAACCSDFDAECFTASNNRSSNSSCEDFGPVCATECKGDAQGSERCKACCTTFPENETPWECPKPSIICLAEEYGVGNYSETWDDFFACPESSGDAGFQYDFESGVTVEACLSLCEAVGAPGCCQFNEVLEGNVTKVDGCQFKSAHGDTLDEIRNSTGSEPEIQRPRRLIEIDGEHYYHRGVRCEPGSRPPSTDSPSTTIAPTDETTVPGSDGGASRMGTSLAVVVACGFLFRAI